MASPAPEDTGIDVVNAPKDVWGDVYHQLLRAPWSLTLLAIAGMVLAIDVLFALAFLLTGGIANARPGSFADAFFFSVQTLGTIGYGKLAPVSLAAHLLVTIESFCGITGLALMTGLMFAKFARPSARVLWSEVAVVAVVDGVPSLM